MNGNALGQPTILQPGQMPMLGQNFQYAGFPHPSGGPVMTPGGGGTGAPLQGPTVGMVPGVPGSMGLNPGMGGPIQGQQQPGGPVMTPGGGGTGAPLQGGVGMVPGVPGSMGTNPGGPQGLMGQIQAWRGQLHDWHQQRPDHQGMDPAAWQQAIQAWRQARPDQPQFMHPGSPQNALSPPMLPPTPAPGVMPVNPGMSASVNPNQYGLPTYGG